MGQTSGPMGLDLNVEGAWIQGTSGRGVVVSVVDDGEMNHSACNRDTISLADATAPSFCRYLVGNITNGLHLNSQLLINEHICSIVLYTLGVEKSHPDLRNNFVSTSFGTVTK